LKDQKNKIMTNELKTLVQKLDREIWGAVESGQMSQSLARQESGKLIEEYTQSLRSQLEAIEKICITSGPLTAEEIVDKIAAIAQAALKE